MRRILSLTLFALAVAPAAADAQAPPPEPSPFAKAPWWMERPIVASTGYVRMEVPANRGKFTAEFQALGKDPAAATKAAADKVRALGQTLRGFGADKVRVETTFQVRPLYEQYRDKEGNLQNNVRPDKIERYEVSANVTVEVSEIGLIERVYAAVLSAAPSSTSAVEFSLRPDNELNAQLFRAAVADAGRRARLAAEAAGARLGAVKLIDPTGRACQTDVLVAGADGDGQATEGLTPHIAPAPPSVVAETVVSDAPPIPAEAVRLPLQPPPQDLTASACVVYGLL